MHALRATLLSPSLLRIEYAPTGKFSDHPSLFALHAPSGQANHAHRQVFTTSAARGSRPLSISTPHFHFSFTPDSHAPHPGNMRALISHPSPPADVPLVDGRVLWTPASKPLHNLGGTLETLDGVRAPVPTGLGLLARDGWALVDDSDQHLLVNNWAAHRADFDLHQNLDWYLFAYGSDYHAAFHSLAIIAGHVPLPRRSALGSWYSRYWPYTSGEFRGILLEYRAHAFPLDVMVLDMDWHKEGWTGWSWNRDLIPDPEALLSYLHEEQLDVTLNLHPADGVAPHEDRYTDFMRALHRSPTDQTIPFDAANRTYMSALFSAVLAPLEHPPAHSPRAGVDFWWVDWQQDRFTRSIPGLTNLRWLNHLFFHHTSRPALPASDLPSRRGLSFSRWAGWGDHRHPIHFSGDAHTGWKMLAFQVPFTVQAGNVGCFYWSHDIGGHFGPRLEETTARWVQFGALSAALRLHSARSAVLDRRPWTYQPRFLESMRRAFHLRAGLMPTIYTAARASFDHTLPLLRPMYLNCSCDQRAYESPHQFTIHDDLLAAPIVTPGVGERCVATQRVWFPCACRAADSSHSQHPPEYWYDFFTAERHAAGDEAVVAADIDRFPLFARAGAPIFMQPVSTRMSAPIDTLILRLFAAAPGHTYSRDLYEDDADSLDYQHNGFARTTATARWTSNDDHHILELDIAPTEGTYQGQLPRRAIIVELAPVARAIRATINSAPAPIDLDHDLLSGLARLTIPPLTDIRSRLCIRIDFEPADNRAVVERVRRTALLDALGAPSLAGSLTHALVNAAELAPSAPSRAHALAIGAGIALSPTNDHMRFVDSLALIDPAQIDVSIFDSVGPAASHPAPLDTRSFALTAPAGQRAITIPVPDSPLPSPPLGHRASRIVRASFRINHTDLSIDAVARTHLPPLTDFAIAAPFNWDWRWNITGHAPPHPFAPESAPLNAADSFTGADNRRITWSPARQGPKWIIDFTQTSPDRRALAYAWIILHSPADQHATLHFEAAGDKSQIFLNSAPVFTQNGFDTQAAAIDAIDITLRAGKNHLLIKSAEGGGGWGFTAAIESPLPITQHSPL